MSAEMVGLCALQQIVQGHETGVLHVPQNWIESTVDGGATGSYRSGVEGL
jgi:hypothetical protein